VSQGSTFGTPKVEPWDGVFEKIEYFREQCLSGPTAEASAVGPLIAYAFI
jgi:hypothetical protein